MIGPMTTTTPTYRHVRWYDSVIVRVIILCIVLVMCLLGSVLIITRHYFSEVVQEMESQARTVGNDVLLQLEEAPETDLDELENNLMDIHEGFDDIELKPYGNDASFRSFQIERAEDGRFMKVACVPLLLDNRRILLTVRVSSLPQTEIVRAFKNKYLAALAVLFVVALGLMIYFISRTLRPLADLSESCAQIESGNLREVAVRRNAGEVLALEQTFNRMVASLREKEVVEANLRQAQRLSALGNLAAGVAHDVRNPLNTIKLISSHLEGALRKSTDSDAQAAQAATIRSEVGRIEEIVSGFLALAKERELQPEPCRLDELLDECMRLLGKDAEARNVKLTADLRAGDTTLMLDPKMWTRAVLNVLINALQACEEGGRVRMFSRVTDTTCEVEVRDDGPGLSAEAAERAFDPYFTTKATGTGLGLSVTRGIVEEHGGTISLTSVEGLGCQVLITLPLRKTEL